MILSKSETQLSAKGDSIPIEDDKLSSEPPIKKLKGQNKKRPRDTRIPRSEKLCLQYLSEQKCKYGDMCTFSHDIGNIMSNKPPDIGPNCYVYETFGKCRYGLNCRFGGSHIINNSENKVNTELWDKNKDISFHENNLSKDVQISLRTRKYNFKRTNESLCQLRKIGSEERVEADQTTNEEAKNQATDNVVKDDVVAIALDDEKHGANNSEDSREGTLRSCGPITDEDVVRLRKSEVKQVVPYSTYSRN